MKRGKIRRVPRERQLQTVRRKQTVRRSLSKRTIPTKRVGSEMSFYHTFTVPWTILYLAVVKSFCGLNLNVLRSGQEIFSQCIQYKIIASKSNKNAY